MFPYRLACFFGGGEVLERCDCEMGVRSWESMRRFHKCNCLGPSQCTNPQHRHRRIINHMISISDKENLPIAVRWKRMYRIAFPDHQRDLAPCIPLVPAILSLTQRRGSEFRSTMARRLAKDEGLNISQATGEMQMFLKRLPLFYDLITWPEVWSLGDAGAPVDEVDESSTTQPAKVEEWLADVSIQQDDGAADEEPDNEQPDAQTEQESEPSAPSSNQTVAGLLGWKGGWNEAPNRHHSRSGTV